MSKYEAVLSCPCGFKEKLSDKDFEDIIMERKEISLKCGHSKYGMKIRAKIKCNPKDWRYGIGQSREAR